MKISLLVPDVLITIVLILLLLGIYLEQLDRNFCIIVSVLCFIYALLHYIFSKYMKG